MMIKCKKADDLMSGDRCRNAADHHRGIPHGTHSATLNSMAPQGYHKQHTGQIWAIENAQGSLKMMILTCPLVMYVRVIMYIKDKAGQRRGNQYCRRLCGATGLKWIYIQGPGILLQA